jgi:hypothetical protein
MPSPESVELFEYQTEPLDAAEAARADQIRERLKSAGIAWHEGGRSCDYEGVVPDPDSPHGWAVELGSRSWQSIRVAAEDFARARAVLAESP